MKNGLNNALAIESIRAAGRDIKQGSRKSLLAGGPGSGRHKMGETASTKDEHNAAAQHHNERAQVYMQHKGQDAQDLAFEHSKAAQAHANAARLGTDRHTRWAQQASGAANVLEDKYPKALAAKAGGIHSILDKYRIKDKKAKENPPIPSGNSKLEKLHARRPNLKG